MQATSSWGSLWMPLSLSYSASNLRERGFEVELIDCQAEGISLRDLSLRLLDSKPSFIVINTGFPSIDGDMQAAQTIKDVDSHIKVVAIGMYPTLLGRKMLGRYEAVDFAIVGEPEWALSNLAEAISKNLPLDDLKGIVYREDDEIVETSPQVFSKNEFNELPVPARDILDNGAYRHLSDNAKFTHISIARGCPYNCSFCAAHHYYGREFRTRTVDSIIDEIKECISEHGISTFVFWGESFTIDRDYALQICNEILKSGLEIKWYTRSRVDNLDYELLRKMKEAGCTGMSLGIESVDHEVLQRCGKNTTEEQITKSIEMTKRAGIQVVGHFVFGLPGDNKISANKSIEFAKNSNLDFAQFYCAVPYPQTELWKEASKNGWIESQDYSGYSLSSSVMKNDALSRNEIIALRDKAFTAFYKRPRNLKKTVMLLFSKRSIKPHLGFLNWAKTTSA